MIVNGFSPCDLVKRISDQKVGVVISDDFALCEPDQANVVFDGVSYSEATDIKDLEKIGPENAVADPKKCGAGKGSECCIFLTKSKGFTCERFGSLRNRLIFLKDSMHAKREPTAMFPKCQLSN
ncbi:MAG: hypothetical protein PHT40_04385 [Patescibacteria group bacterium]|nr:hypothetical protein [Patescibacteria group bacterium]